VPFFHALIFPAADPLTVKHVRYFYPAMVGAEAS